MKFSRKDFFEKKCSIWEYYSQWVTDSIKSLVKSRLGEAIINSQDEYLNDIDLIKWDKLAQFVTYYPDNSLATRVCILKSAAKQLKS